MRQRLESSSTAIRRIMMDLAGGSGKNSHLGGGLSSVEILNCLYGDFLSVHPSRVTDSTRDRFIMSKGHGVLSLYATLSYYGFISRNEISSYMQDESHLISHPVMNLSLGIESSNGSLGQGLGFGIGLALSAKRSGQSYKTVVLLGDGECNEGSVWESVRIASHLRVGNLLAIVDDNGFQSDGDTEQVSGNPSLAQAWSNFGWKATEVDGHNVGQIIDALSHFNIESEQPLVIIAKTVKGKGISFMERNNEWHHNRLTPDFYDRAMKELGTE